MFIVGGNWDSEFCLCVQISCKGRDSVPDNDAVNQFVYEVSPLNTHLFIDKV